MCELTYIDLCICANCRVEQVDKDLEDKEEIPDPQWVRMQNLHIVFGGVWWPVQYWAKTTMNKEEMDGMRNMKKKW